MPNGVSNTIVRDSNQDYMKKKGILREISPLRAGFKSQLPYQNAHFLK